MVQEEAEATAGPENTTSNVTVEDSAPMPVEDPGTVPMTSHEETAPITIPESLPPPQPPKRMRRGTDIDFLREVLLRVEIEKTLLRATGRRQIWGHKPIPKGVPRVTEEPSRVSPCLKVFPELLYREANICVQMPEILPQRYCHSSNRSADIRLVHMDRVTN
ncbi:unnamed protein product [Arctogadus glacialis]